MGAIAHRRRSGAHVQPRSPLGIPRILTPHDRSGGDCQAGRREGAIGHVQDYDGEHLGDDSGRFLGKGHRGWEDDVAGFGLVVQGRHEVEGEFHETGHEVYETGLEGC